MLCHHSSLTTGFSRCCIQLWFPVCANIVECGISWAQITSYSSIRPSTSFLAVWCPLIYHNNMSEPIYVTLLQSKTRINIELKLWHRVIIYPLLYTNRIFSCNILELQFFITWKPKFNHFNVKKDLHTRFLSRYTTTSWCVNFMFLNL